MSQLADSLSSDALEQLAKDFKQDKISAERVLAAASNAKSHSVASELKRLRLKQEMEGVLTSSQAIEAANHFASELLEAIRDICYHFKIDGEEFIQRMMNRHDQIIEETILAKADQLAKDRLAEGHYKELLNE